MVFLTIQDIQVSIWFLDVLYALYGSFFIQSNILLFIKSDLNIPIVGTERVYRQTFFAE